MAAPFMPPEQLAALHARSAEQDPLAGYLRSGTLPPPPAPVEPEPIPEPVSEVEPVDAEPAIVPDPAAP